MSETERRLRYDNRRVLIETARVLAPQFGSAVLCLSGAQVELLRNVVAYLNRASTFVTEYFASYYLTPTVSEWDSLQSIVADMEEALMGNENVVWGYNGNYKEFESDPNADEGANTLVFSVVPSGEVWVIGAFTAWDLTTAAARITLQVQAAVGLLPVKSELNPPALHVVSWAGSLVVVEGESLLVYFAGCASGDTIAAQAFGYKMKVPV